LHIGEEDGDVSRKTLVQLVVGEEGRYEVPTRKTLVHLVVGKRIDR
jgi:hypothetical protein